MDHLLEEFRPISNAEWEAAIARELKGAGYAKRLIRQSEEGFEARPYYRAENLRDLAFLDALPGAFPYRRGSSTSGNWRIREEIDERDVETANRAACAAVAAGAEEITFSDALAERAEDLGALLRNLDKIPVHFERADEVLLRLLNERAGTERLGTGGRGARISTGYDALAGIDIAAEVIGDSRGGFVPFTVHGETFEESGATAVEEVGFTLAAGIDFLALTAEHGVDVERTAAALEFSFAVGSTFFFQIAKLRAFRMVWARAIECFGGARIGAAARIAARTSRWNKTVYDPHVNILRATTEAMSAVLGGVDSVTVAPFDTCYKRPDETSRRLARNTQLILKHEACMGRVADAGGGSYYLETLTDLLANESWKLMQQIEARGGYRKAQAEGTIALALERSMATREKAVTARRRVLVGTNHFANPADRALNRVDSERMQEIKRSAHQYEEVRLRTERHAAVRGSTPRVLLAEFGDVKARMASSRFATNFFACAGFETITRRFRRATEIASADSDLIVLCSADPKYAAIVTELMPRLKALGRSIPVIVAGNPAYAESLVAARVADFVHARSNPVELLTKWQARMGIES
jgi:methylmalonyl-CoA mutase